MIQDWEESAAKVKLQVLKSMQDEDCQENGCKGFLEIQISEGQRQVICKIIFILPDLEYCDDIGNPGLSLPQN